MQRRVARVLDRVRARVIPPDVERDPQTGEAIFRPGYLDGWSLAWLGGGIAGRVFGHVWWIAIVAAILIAGRAAMAAVIAARGARPGVRYEPRFFE